MSRLQVAGSPRRLQKFVKRWYWTLFPKRLSIITTGREPFIFVHLPWKKEGNIFYSLHISRWDEEEWLVVSSTSEKKPYVYSWKKAYAQLLIAKEQQKQEQLTYQLNRSLSKKNQEVKGHEY